MEVSYPQKECNHETGKGFQKNEQKKRKRRPKCPEKKKQKLLEQKEKLRMDVINKGILRMVRRFFHRLFTERNNDVVQKRFINYEFSELIERIEQLLLDIGFSDDIHNLAIFLFKIFRISTKDIVEGSSAPYQDAEVVNAAMTNYTRAKYSRVNKWKYFRICLQYIYSGTLADKNIKCMSHLLQTEEKCIKGDREKYLETFETLNADIIKNPI